MTLGLVYNNGWESGDWHLVYFDIFHEQPPQKDRGYWGISVGLFGIIIGIGFSYEQNI